MKKQKWEIHSIFKCESCGKEFEGRGNSKALSHAKKYKHKSGCLLTGHIQGPWDSGGCLPEEWPSDQIRL